jgi:hypothetical protein
VTVACVKLADALHVSDPTFWGLSADLLAAPTAGAPDPLSLEGLEVVAGHPAA